MLYHEIIYRRNRSRCKVEEKQKVHISDTRRRAQPAVATTNVLSNPEAGARAPMTIPSHLLHSETTYVEDIPEGVLSEETSTDDKLVRRSSRVSKPLNRLISEI